MIFDYLKFYLKDANTGELDIHYLCEDCLEEMERPYYTVQILHHDKGLMYHFVCEDCYRVRKKLGDTTRSIKDSLMKREEEIK